MKNPPKTGRSMRSGNAPSPYLKYQKTEQRYDMVALRKKYPSGRRQSQDAYVHEFQMPALKGA